MTVNLELLDQEIALNVRDLIRRWWTIDILVVTDTIVSFGPDATGAPSGAPVEPRTGRLRPGRGSSRESCGSCSSCFATPGSDAGRS